MINIIDPYKDDDSGKENIGVAAGLVANKISSDGSVLSIITLNQEEYDALDPIDPNTLYFIETT